MTKRVYYLDLLPLTREAAAARLAMRLLTHKSRTATSHLDEGVCYRSRHIQEAVPCRWGCAAAVRRPKAGSSSFHPITYVMNAPSGEQAALLATDYHCVDLLTNWFRSKVWTFVKIPSILVWN